MTKINNYEALVVERKRLEQNLDFHRATLKREFRELKESLKPMSLIKNMIGIREGVVGPLAGAGLNAGIDMVVKNNVLAKAGFLARTVVPMALKTVINFFSKRREDRSKQSPSAID